MSDGNGNGNGQGQGPNKADWTAKVRDWSRKEIHLTPTKNANGQTINRLRGDILRLAQERFGRELTATEQDFVESRGGFVALEAIYDTVRAVSIEELEAYMNAETCGCVLCRGACPECGGNVGPAAGSLDSILCSMCHATFRHSGGHAYQGGRA